MLFAHYVQHAELENILLGFAGEYVNVVRVIDLLNTTLHAANPCR
jgi:hypothetical protein